MVTRRGFLKGFAAVAGAACVGWASIFEAPTVAEIDVLDAVRRTLAKAVQASFDDMIINGIPEGDGVHRAMKSAVREAAAIEFRPRKFVAYIEFGHG